MPPFNAPYFSSDSNAYAEHVGIYLHLGVDGDDKYFL